MNENILIESISVLGLNEKESKIYLSLLRSGNSPASLVAKNAGINRVTAYGILEVLEKKGLVQSAHRQGMQHFTALHPDLLVENAKQRTEMLEKVLPDLKSLMQHHDFRPSMRFFEGISGIKKAYQETLKSKTDILNYANSKNIRDHWPEYDQEYVEKRKRKKIFLKGLAPADDFGDRVLSEDKNSHRETRLIPHKFFEVENEIKIYDNSMMIASFMPHPFAIIIESKPVADTQRQIFDIVWNAARHLK